MLYNLLKMLKFGEKQYPTFMHIFMQLLNIICRGYRFNHLPFIQMNHFDLVKNKKLQLNEMTYLIVKCFKICHIFGWNMKSQLVFHFLCYYNDQRIHQKVQILKMKNEYNNWDFLFPKIWQILKCHFTPDQTLI